MMALTDTLVSLIDFEAAYQPEIASFAPPPPTPRGTASTPSTAFRGSFPPHDESPSSQWPNIAGPLNGGGGGGGGKSDETSVVRQVSLKQRSARLSFLPGRRQQENEPRAEADGVMNGSSPEPKVSPHSSGSRSSGKARRESIFRSQSLDDGWQDNTAPSTNGTGRRGSLVSKGSLDRSISLDRSMSLDKEVPDKDAPIKKTGSMRKRLSLFKMGMKSHRRGGVMGSVDEE